MVAMQGRYVRRQSNQSRIDSSYPMPSSFSLRLLWGKNTRGGRACHNQDSLGRHNQSPTLFLRNPTRGTLQQSHKLAGFDKLFNNFPFYTLQMFLFKIQ